MSNQVKHAHQLMRNLTKHHHTEALLMQMIFAFEVANIASQSQTKNNASDTITNTFGQAPVKVLGKRKLKNVDLQHAATSGPTENKTPRIAREG